MKCLWTPEVLINVSADQSLGTPKVLAMSGWKLMTSLTYEVAGTLEVLVSVSANMWLGLLKYW